MPTQETLDRISLKDELINAFRPIEQLFKIMNTTSPEVYGQTNALYAEVGLVLCNNFRQILDKIVTDIS